jgi:hypothetical protein
VTVPPVTACPPEETFAVIVTIDPLTGPAEVAVSVVTVVDCAPATPDSNRRQKNHVKEARRALPLRPIGVSESSSLAETNNPRRFRGSNIYFLEYFRVTVKRRMDPKTMQITSCWV